MTGWNGRTVTTARAAWKARLPLSCYLCGGIVDGTRPWVVEHILERSNGGHVTDPTNQWVSHRTCSDKSGGKLGASRTNARHQPVNTARIEERPLKW